MRLTGGFLKGRVIFYKKTPDIRPTQSIVREAIFNMLGESVKQSSVLELFAGTGAMGFEALSRGASSVTFVDNCSQSIKTLLKNTKILKMEEKVDILKMDAESAIRKLQKQGCLFDIIFADPPYSFTLLKIRRVFLKALEILKDDGFFIIETDKNKSVLENFVPSGIELKKEKRYGSTKVSIFWKKRTNCCLSR